MAVDEQGSGSVDRALTVATQSRRRRGRGAESTRIEYAREWKKWGAWRHPLDPTVVSPELLAVYAEHLCRAGVAPGTIRKAIAAIRSELRSRGKPVPDGVPAHVVLRDHEDTLREAGRGAKRAEPISLDGLVLMLSTLDLAQRAGQRDAAVLHLLFAGLRIGEAEALNLAEVVPVPGEDGELPTVRLDVEGRAPVMLLHWRSTDGVHDPRLCPVEAVMGWRGVTASLPGASPSWPLLRPVDDVGRIGGIDAGWSGTLGLAGGRLGSSGIAAVFTRAVAAAGLADESLRIVPQSLRLGGVWARLAGGAAGLGAFTAGGWSAASRIVSTFLEQFTPAGAGDVTVTWSPPPPAPGDDDERGIAVPMEGEGDDGVGAGT